MAVTEVLLFAAIILTILSLLVKHRYGFWQRHGAPYLQPEFPFGNFKEMGKTIHPAFLTQRIYNQFKRKGPFVGLYIFLNPVMLVTDLHLAKKILIKDFNCFPNRGVYFNEKDDPLSSHLFSLEGSRWRDLRAKITPTFSTGRIRMAFPAVLEVAGRFIDYLEVNCVGLDATEIRDSMARFTTDVIGRCAFGLECNSFRDPENEFRRIGRKHFDTPRNHPLKVFIMKTFRGLANSMGMKQIHDDVSEFFSGVVRETIEHREREGVSRGDFLDLLIKLKNTGRLEDSGEDIGQLTFDEIAAQAFIFFTAGFETTSSTLTYTLYELARNQAIQEVAREDVEKVLKKFDGSYSYECFQSMTYLDQCINETLRKYPPVVNLERVVDRDYMLEESGIILPQGMKIMIPAYAIHHDPDVYANPSQYDPDRFCPEQAGNRDPCSFLPFGEGPRICIGLRFGMLQARVGLAMILKNFRILPCSKTEDPIIFSKRAFVLTPINGMWLKLEKLH
ncbi:cytochrome P450 6a8-like [Ochlerotatus camptorhynchus]|uniref:cytochrome P450 6a8-like n=1 Tax=Ochlerotatus camptorhynchus TaxID=644619 RepID=UPI0031DD2521